MRIAATCLVKYCYSNILYIEQNDHFFHINEYNRFPISENYRDMDDNPNSILAHLKQNAVGLILTPV